ncbi:MAG: type II toxin-antitoxin system VapC family toxin, partial [Candidatus Competibacterales bacterium]|nr:type II toxin-antitoxin system VapC family toxin [Candidatus Competibacterales bacterium]
ENGYAELSITSRHVLALGQLPDLHQDPFDRVLVAQAQTEGCLLLTVDERVAAYPGPVRRV